MEVKLEKERLANSYLKEVRKGTKEKQEAKEVGVSNESMEYRLSNGTNKLDTIDLECMSMARSINGNNEFENKLNGSGTKSKSMEDKHEMLGKSRC